MDYSESGVVFVLPRLDAFYNPDSLANILSLSEISQYYRVIMDTEESNSITVFISATHCLTLSKIGQGLYTYDTAGRPKLVKLLSQRQPICMFSTVAANRESYSIAEVQGAENARTL